MRNKIENELLSLAQDIQNSVGSYDVRQLKERAAKLYEQLSLLVLIRDFAAEIPNQHKTVKELEAEFYSPIFEIDNIDEIKSATDVADVNDEVELPVEALEDDEIIVSEDKNKQDQKNVLEEEIKVMEILDDSDDDFDLPILENTTTARSFVSNPQNIIIDEFSIDENEDGVEGDGFTLEENVEEIVGVEENEVEDEEALPPVLEEETLTEIDELLEADEDLEIPQLLDEDEVNLEGKEEFSESQTIEEEVLPNLFTISDAKPKKEPKIAEEFNEAFSIDEATDLFDNAVRVKPKAKIAADNFSFQIEEIDKNLFINHLFKGNIAEYTRVISQLSTLETLEEAQKYFAIVKKDYNWEGLELYETRFLMLIEKKFN